MIVACRISNGLDIGGFLLKGSYVGPDYPVRGAPGRPRERIAGYEITRDVPVHLWECWYAANARGPIVQNGIVFGTDDETALAEFCWANRQEHGHAYGAGQAYSQAPTLSSPPGPAAGSGTGKTGQ